MKNTNKISINTNTNTNTNTYNQNNITTSFLKTIKSSEINKKNDEIIPQDDVEIIINKYFTLKNKLNSLWNKLS